VSSDTPSASGDPAPEEPHERGADLTPTPPPPPPPSAPESAPLQPPPPPLDWRPPEGQVQPSVPPAIAAGPARDGTWQRPSPKLWPVRILQLAVGSVASLLIAFGIFSAAVSAAAGGVAALVVAVVAIGFAVTVQRRVKAWGYAERDDDLLVRRGVLFRRLSVIPYGRMQFVDVTAGPFERAFGLATVRMHTAAAASDARIPGLPAEEAARLRDQLTALGEAQAAGL
jgi:membrane protein YdbS with pleckstrin-like domain